MTMRTKSRISSRRESNDLALAPPPTWLSCKSNHILPDRAGLTIAHVSYPAGVRSDMKPWRFRCLPWDYKWTPRHKCCRDEIFLAAASHPNKLEGKYWSKLFSNLDQTLPLRRILSCGDFSQPTVEGFTRSLFGLQPKISNLEYLEWLEWRKEVRENSRLPKFPDGHRPGWQSWRINWDSKAPIKPISSVNLPTSITHSYPR